MPKKNTAFLRCLLAFETQTKLKQTDKSHKVRRNQTEKRSKKDEKISFFLRNLQIAHCLSGLQGCEKIEKKYLGIEPMPKVVGVVDIISAEIRKIFTG